MKSCTGLILILLGLLFKASSGDNSTQVYYLEVHIEAGAYDNFTELLREFNRIPLDVFHTATVTNFNITTECNQRISNKVNCTCYPGYSWSDEMCANFTGCCKINECIMDGPNPRAMCLSSERVLVNGSFTVSDAAFTYELDNPASDTYKKTVKNYTEQLERTYSTLKWFDSLQITRLRQGSVIADFEMLLMAPFGSTQLEQTVKDLKSTTNYTFDLVVTRLVKIQRDPDSQEPILYDSNSLITCSTPEDLGKPTWFFQQNAKLPQEVTNGTEAKVFYDSRNSTISISRATEVWKGTFTCDYKQGESILYRASQYLDIALLPEIFIISVPQFPSCKGSLKQFYIIVQCIIPNTTENYTVTWNGTYKLVPDQIVSLGNGQIAYQAQQPIFCDEGREEVTVTCEFTNRRGQKKTSTLDIPIIKSESSVCPADNDWPEAKTDKTAKLLCGFNRVGLQQRNCTNNTYGEVISLCINQDLNNLLNDAENLQRGLGIVQKNAKGMFTRLSTSTQKSADIGTYANVKASLNILQTMANASVTQNSLWNETVYPDFVKSSSSLLNGSMNDSWKPLGNEENYTLPLNFLRAIEGIIKQTNITANDELQMFQQDNVQVIITQNDSSSSTQKAFSSDFGVNVTTISSKTFVKTAFRNLAGKLPDTVNNEATIPSGVLLSVIDANNTKNVNISMSFNQNRIKNHKMYCAFLDTNTSQWSTKGCTWGGAEHPNLCTCNHLTAFTVLMAKEPIKLAYMEELTYAGLGCSVLSLVLCLVIEFLVWNTVVKTNIAHFRHTVSVNIMVCLLIADCSFLAAPTPSSNPSNWCLSLTVMKHFCYLAVFFWMLCLSLGLMHQVIFVFVHLRKKVYLGLCIFLGYVCPLVIVVVTFISYNNGRTGSYYSSETCWLIYESALKGSIHAFLFPVFIIVFVNMFTMVVVISRILKPTLSEGSSHDQKEVARSIVKTIVLLTPTLGITWILGLFVLMLDLTMEPYAQIVNYAFTLFNSLQGFLILLTVCLGEKRVRDALRKRFGSQQSVKSKSEPSSTRITPATKKK